MNAFRGAAAHFIRAKVGRMACIAFLPTFYHFETHFAPFYHFQAHLPHFNILKPTSQFYHFEAHLPVLSFRLRPFYRSLSAPPMCLHLHPGDKNAESF